MITESARLQHEIDTEKADLIDNLSALETKARDAADWRAHIRKHPLQAVGVALAAGAVLGFLTGSRSSRGDRPRSADDASTDPSPGASRSHPILERAVDTFVAVAAARTVELLKDAVSG
jgi:hypothetical protein